MPRMARDRPQATMASPAMALNQQEKDLERFKDDNHGTCLHQHFHSLVLSLLVAVDHFLLPLLARARAIPP